MSSIIFRIRRHLRFPLFINAYFLMGRTAINAISGFAFWALAAIFFKTEDIGLASAIISAATLLASFSTLGLGFGIIRFLPNAGENGRRLINFCFTVAGSVGMILGLIFILGLNLWSPNLILVREQPLFFISFLVLVAASTIIPLLDRTLTAERAAKYVFVMTILVALLKVVVVLGFIVIAASAFGIVTAMTVATALTVIISLLFLLPRSHKSFKPGIVFRIGGGTELLRYSFGSYGADVLATTPGLVLPLLVVNILGAESNAYFYIAWMIASLITAIPLAISTSLFVEGSHDESTFITNARKALALSFSLVVPVVLIVFLAGRYILSIFGPEYGENGTLLLWFLASSSIPTVFIMVYMIQRRVLKDIKSLTIISLSLLIIQVGLSYVMMGYMGIKGIGLAVLIAHILVALPIVYKWFKLYLLRS